MRVIQLVPVLSARDAVGNEVLAYDRILRDAGYETAIFTSETRGVEDMDNIVISYEGEELTEEDVVIYHFAINNRLTDYCMRQNAKKIFRYHNVTPAHFFQPYDAGVAWSCALGKRQAKAFVGFADYCTPVSDFSKRELVEMGYDVPIDVIPIPLDPDEYHSSVDGALVEDLRKQTGTKVLFVGRVAPNKCFEDVIKAFACYKSRYDEGAILNLVGSFDDADRYYLSLMEYVRKIGVDDIHFVGSVAFSQLNAYYKGSDVLLCQSEHEGFCVPLEEAMMFDLPIIGYDCCAVGETMGKGTLALPTKDPEVVAGMINRLQNDPSLKQRVLFAQRRRMDDFALPIVKRRLLDVVEKVVCEAQ